MRVFAIWVLMGLMGLMGYDAYDALAHSSRVAPTQEQELGQAQDDNGGGAHTMEDGTPCPGPPN